MILLNNFTTFTYQYNNSENKFQIWQNLPFFILDFRLRFPGNALNDAFWSISLQQMKLKTSNFRHFMPMACLYVSKAVWCLSHTLKPQNSFSNQSSLKISCTFSLLIKQHINVCKALYCVK